MFRLTGLDPTPFQPLFALDDATLRARGTRRLRADSDFGYPCRVSLADAVAGEEILLLPYAHHDVDSPYRASGPIYVRRGAARASLAPGEVPACVTRRLISLRAYDASALIVSAEVVEGAAVAAQLGRLFADSAVAYVHLHNARPGCFSCLATRSG
jgi:hypothetical protein